MFYKSLIDCKLIFDFSSIAADSSADPLLDEHFRRSLGANYQSLFKKSPVHHVTSSSVPFVTSSVKSRSPSLSPDSSSSSIKVPVDSVVKAFKDDMDMEGYTGKTCFNLQCFVVTKSVIVYPQK